MSEIGLRIFILAHSELAHSPLVKCDVCVVCNDTRVALLASASGRLMCVCSLLSELSVSMQYCCVS